VCSHLPVIGKAETPKETKKRKAEDNVKREKTQPVKKAKRIRISDNVKSFTLTRGRDEVKSCGASPARITVNKRLTRKIEAEWGRHRRVPLI
jgi:hypothetical protein